MDPRQIKTPTRPVTRRGGHYQPRRGVSPWTIIGWFLVAIIALVVFINVVIGCALVTAVTEAATR